MFSTLQEFLPSKNLTLGYKPLSISQTSLFFTSFTNQKQSLYCKYRSVYTFSSNFHKTKSKVRFSAYNNNFLFSQKNVMYGLGYFAIKPKSLEKETPLFVLTKDLKVRRDRPQNPQWILRSSLKSFDDRKVLQSVFPTKQISLNRCQSFKSFAKYLEKKENIVKKFEGFKLQKQSTFYQIPIRNACKFFILYVCGSFCWLYLITYSNSKKNLSTSQKINFLFQEVVFNNLPLFQKENLVYTKNLYNKPFKEKDKKSSLEKEFKPLVSKGLLLLANQNQSSTIHDFSTQNYIGFLLQKKANSFLEPQKSPEKPIGLLEKKNKGNRGTGSFFGIVQNAKTKETQTSLVEVQTSQLLKNRFIFLNKKPYLNNLYYYEKKISPFVEEKEAKLTFFARKPLFFSYPKAFGKNFLSHQKEKGLLSLEGIKKQRLTQKEQYIYSGTSLILSPEFDFFPRKLEHINKKMSTHSGFPMSFLPKLGQKEKFKWCNDLNPSPKDNFLYTERNYNYAFDQTLGSLSNFSENEKKALYVKSKNPKITTSLFSGLRKKDLQFITSASINRDGFVTKKELQSEAFSLDNSLILNHIFKLLRSTQKDKNFVISKTKENVREKDQTEKTDLFSLKRKPLKQKNKESRESFLPSFEVQDFQGLRKHTQNLWFDRKDCKNTTVWSKVGSTNDSLTNKQKVGQKQKENSKDTDFFLGLSQKVHKNPKQEDNQGVLFKETLIKKPKARLEKSNLRRFFFEKKRYQKSHFFFLIHSRLHSGFNFPNTSIINKNQKEWKKGITLTLQTENLKSQKHSIPRTALSSSFAEFSTLKERQKYKNTKGIIHITEPTIVTQKRSLQTDSKDQSLTNSQTSFINLLYELSPLKEYISYKQSDKSKDLPKASQSQTKVQGFIEFQKKDKKRPNFYELKNTRFKELWNFTKDNRTTETLHPFSLSDQKKNGFDQKSKKNTFGVTMDSKRILSQKSFPQFWKNQTDTSFVILDQNGDIQIKEKQRTSGLSKTFQTDFNSRPNTNQLQQKDPYNNFNQNAPESFFGVPYLQLGERFTIEKLKSKSQIGTFYSVHSQNNFNNLQIPTFPFASMGNSLKTVFGTKFLKQTSKTKTQNLVTDARLVKDWSVVHFPEKKLSQNIFENDSFSTFTKDLFFEFDLLGLSKQTNKKNDDTFLQKNLFSFKRIAGKANGYLINPFQYYNPGTKRERNIEDTMLTLEGYKKSRLFPKVKVSFIGISAVTLPINEKLQITKANKDIDLQSILGGMRQRTEVERKAENFIQARAFKNSVGIETGLYEGLHDSENSLSNNLEETNTSQKDQFSTPEAFRAKEKGQIVEKQSLLEENDSLLSEENDVLPISGHTSQKKSINQRSPSKKLRFTNCYPLQTLLSVGSQKKTLQRFQSHTGYKGLFSENYIPSLGFWKFLSTNSEGALIQNSSQTKGFYFEKLPQKTTLGFTRKFLQKGLNSSKLLKSTKEGKESLLTLKKVDQKPRTQNSLKTSFRQRTGGFPIWTTPSYENIAGKLSKILFFGTIWFSYKILASKLTHSTQFLPAVFTEAIGLQSFQKKYRIIVPQKTKESFKNLAGAEKTLAELRDLIWTFGLVGTSGPRGEHSYLSSLSYFGNWAVNLKVQGRRNSVFSKDRNRFLLVGPPGTGKTLLVKALAKEANVPIIVQPVSQLRMITGVENPISALFHVARQIKPCIIFLDELDTLGTDFHAPNSTLTGEQKGSNAQWASLARKFTYTLLLELDGLTSSTQDLLIIGATNRPETLNPALTRAGRFETIINCSLPSQKQRFSVLSLYLSLLRKKEFNKGKIGPTLVLKQKSNQTLNLLKTGKPGGSTKKDSSFKNLPSFNKKVKNNQKFYLHYLAKKSFGLSQASIGTAVNESAMDSILNHSSAFHTLKSLQVAIDSVKTLSSQSTNSSHFVNPFVPVTNFNSLWKDFDFKKGQTKSPYNSKRFLQKSNAFSTPEAFRTKQNDINERFQSNADDFSNYNLNVKIWPFLVYMSYQTTGSLVFLYQNHLFKKKSKITEKKQVLKKITPIKKNKVSRNTLLARRAQIRQNIINQRFSIKNKNILCDVKNKPIYSTLEKTQRNQLNQTLESEKTINGTLNNKINFILSLYRNYAGLGSTNLYSSIRPQNLKLSNKFGLYRNPIAVSANVLILKYLTTKFNSMSGPRALCQPLSETSQFDPFPQKNHSLVQSQIGQRRVKNNMVFSSSKISPKFISQKDFLKIMAKTHIETQKGFVVKSTSSSLFQKNRDNKNSFRFKEELSRQIQLTRPLTTSWFRIYLSRPIFRYEGSEYIENREYYPQNNYNLITQSLHIANLSFLAHRLSNDLSFKSEKIAFVPNTREKNLEEKTFVGQSLKELGESSFDLTLYLAIVASIFHKTSLLIGKNRELLDYCVYNNLRYGTVYDFTIKQICQNF